MSMSKRIAAAVFTSALVLVPMSSPASAAKPATAPAGKVMAEQIKAEKTGKTSGDVSVLRIDWY